MWTHPCTREMSGVDSYDYGSIENGSIDGNVSGSFAK